MYVHVHSRVLVRDRKRDLCQHTHGCSPEWQTQSVCKWFLVRFEMCVVFFLENNLNFIMMSRCYWFYPFPSKLFCSIECNRTVIQILIYFPRLKKSRYIIVFYIFSTLMALNKISIRSCMTDRGSVCITWWNRPWIRPRSESVAGEEDALVAVSVWLRRHAASCCVEVSHEVACSVWRCRWTQNGGKRSILKHCHLSS